MFSINPSLLSETENEIPELVQEFILSNDFGNDSLYNTSSLSKYDLTVVLHEEDAKIEGKMIIDYWNNHTQTFSALPFHIYLSGMKFDLHPGKMEIIEVFETDSFQELDFEILDSQQLMWINLSNPLKQFTNVQFTILFNASLPDGGIDRSNFHNLGNNTDIFKYAVGYPMPCVYDQWDGWNIDPYLNHSDPFYSEMAFYNFSVEVPTGMIVAATGELIHQEDFGTTIKYYYDPKYPVREVTFSASRHFIVQSEIYDGTNISTYYMPFSEHIWDDNGLFISKEAFKTYEAIVGDYPYPTLNIVEEYTGYGGMEHPCQVYISSIFGLYNMTYQFQSVIAHEIGHQWFYHLIGNDEVDHGHLDEGLTVWLEDYFIHLQNPEFNIFDNEYYYNMVRYKWKSSNYSPEPINSSIYDYINPRLYQFNAYTKAPCVYETLRQTIGHENFIKGLQLFFERNQFKIAWLSDLQKAFENVIEENLDWFFNPWFDNAYIPNYEVIQVKYFKNNNSVSIDIVDQNSPLHIYEYRQNLTFELYDKKERLILKEIALVEGKTHIQFLNVESKPHIVRIMLINGIVSENHQQNDSYIEFTENSVSGYNLLIIFSTLGISLSLKKKRDL